MTRAPESGFLLNSFGVIKDVNYYIIQSMADASIADSNMQVQDSELLTVWADLYRNQLSPPHDPALGKALI